MRGSNGVPARRCCDDRLKPACLQVGPDAAPAASRDLRVVDASVFEKAACKLMRQMGTMGPTPPAAAAAAAPAAQAQPAAAGVAKQQCARCGTCAGKLRRCGRCKGPHYCSVDCQRADWRRHQRVCRVPP
jgi:hypothetical protein